MSHTNYELPESLENNKQTEDQIMNRQERRMKDKKNKKKASERLLGNSNDWYELYNIKKDMDTVCSEWLKIVPAALSVFTPDVLSIARNNETINNAIQTINNDIESAKNKIEINFTKHKDIKRRVKDYSELAEIIEIMSEYVNISNNYSASIAQSYELLETSLLNIRNSVITDIDNINTNANDLSTISFTDKVKNETGLSMQMPDYLPPLELFVHENSNLKLGL